jgi:apolipoprotein N-acyltransferase
MFSDARAITVATRKGGTGGADQMLVRGWARSSGSAWVVLALACLVLPFSYGADNVPCAAWLAPLFLLRFVRAQKLWVSMPVLLVVQMAAIAFQMRGMFLDDGAAYWLGLLVGAAPALVPYAIDRGLIRRVSAGVSTLAFPLAYTIVDYVGSFGPYGSWGATGYSQYGELALLQLAAVTGLWGLTFLIGWFAAVGNLIWEEGWRAGSGIRAGCAFLIVLALILLGGGLRLSAFPPHSPTVRIASLSAAPRPAPDALRQLIIGKATADDLARIRAWARPLDEDLLRRADAAARNGARIVFWAEGNASVLKADEPQLLTAGSQLAKRDKIYLGMALAVWVPGATRVLENELVMIEPNGAIAWQYRKAHPVPGEEAAMSAPSDGRLRVLETPFGRLSAAICFDADFPQTLRQAGLLHADIVLNPSNDWAAIDPWHTQMASLRAIEEGASVIHQASHGLSAAFDYEGNRLAAVDYFRSGGATMIAEVPIRGVRTVYARLGDWFAWLCIVGLLTLIVTALARPDLGAAPG